MAIADLRSQATRRTGPQLLDHLNHFELDLKFSAGIWFFSPPFSRFHAKYQPDLSIEQRLEIAATLADEGLRGLEAHYPDEINEDNLDLWKRFTADTGISTRAESLEAVMGNAAFAMFDLMYDLDAASPVESVQLEVALAAL